MFLNFGDSDWMNVLLFFIFIKLSQLFLSALNEHHSQRVGAGTSYVGLGGVESDVKNTLVELFPVGRNFLQKYSRI